MSESHQERRREHQQWPNDTEYEAPSLAVTPPTERIRGERKQRKDRNERGDEQTFPACEETKADGRAETGERRETGRAAHR